MGLVSVKNESACVNYEFHYEKFSLSSQHRPMDAKDFSLHSIYGPDLDHRPRTFN